VHIHKGDNKHILFLFPFFLLASLLPAFSHLFPARLLPLASFSCFGGFASLGGGGSGGGKLGQRLLYLLALALFLVTFNAVSILLHCARKLSSEALPTVARAAPFAHVGGCGSGAAPAAHGGAVTCGVGGQRGQGGGGGVGVSSVFCKHWSAHTQQHCRCEL